MNKLAELKIGLETHVELNTKCKLFCNCFNTSSDVVNEDTCPICLGWPGSKPILNLSALDIALDFSELIGAKVNPVIKFSRKHYYYRDSPKSYQLTQEDCDAICHGGQMPIINLKTKTFTGEFVRFQKVFLEQNPGSQLKKCIDFNRSGKPLLEIVTQPIFRGADQVVHYLQNLRFILLKMNYCIESGNFKSDVNISLGGSRVELKNIGSLKQCKLAIRAQIKRQMNVQVPSPECRSYDDVLDETTWMRQKQTHQQYRILLESEIPLIHVSKNKCTTELTTSRPVRELQAGELIRPIITAGSIRQTTNYFDDLKLLNSKFDSISRELIFSVSTHPLVKKILLACSTIPAPGRIHALVQEFKYHKITSLDTLEAHLIKILENEWITNQQFKSELRVILLRGAGSSKNTVDIITLRSTLETDLNQQYTEYLLTKSEKLKKYIIGTLKKKHRGASYSMIMQAVNE